MNNTAQFVAALRRFLPRDRVIDCSEEVGRRVAATFEGACEPAALIVAEDRDEVCAIVRMARSCGIALYPLSTGRNWGYGSNTPCRDASVVLDLSRLNRILAVDPVLGTATVEPGVTFAQLSKHLLTHAKGFFANVTGAPGNTSVLGNALERGVGIGRYADRIDSVLGIEVLLTTGEVIRTGQRRFGEALVPHRSATIGADMAGLFAQSNFGVVLAMTVPLQRRSRANREIKIAFDGRRRLRRAIEQLRELRQLRVFDSQFVIWNDYRLFARLLDYPDEYVNGALIGPSLRRQLRSLTGVSEWTARITLQGASRAIVEAQEAAVLERFSGGGFNRSARSISPRSPGSTYFGRPDDGSIDSLYWRMPAGSPRSGNPDADRVGAIWCEFACALVGEAVDDATRRGEVVVRAHGMEPLLMLVSAWERSITIVFLLLFDRSEPGRDGAAKRCFRALSAEMLACGCVVARVPTFAMAELPASDDSSDAVLHRIKAALDPAGILSPGRYLKPGA